MNSSFVRLALTLAMLASVRAETHTLKFVNKSVLTRRCMLDCSNFDPCHKAAAAARWVEQSMSNPGCSLSCFIIQPTLLKDGKILPLTNGEYTAEGEFSSAIAYV
jgi:hypothetical protein